MKKKIIALLLACSMLMPTQFAAFAEELPAQQQQDIQQGNDKEYESLYDFLMATPTTFTIGVDTNNYTHSTDSFPSQYDLSDEMMEILLSKEPNGLNQLDMILVEEEEWGGSCFGIATTMVLNRLTQNGDLSGDNALYIGDYQADAKEYMDLDTPVKNQDVLDIINYYMISQASTAANQNSYYVSVMDEEEEGCIPVQDYIDMVKETIDAGKPYMITYMYANGGGHATVALDYWEDTENGKFYIKIFDENRTPYTGWKAEENRKEYKPFDYIEISKDENGEYDASTTALYVYYPDYAEVFKTEYGVDLGWDDAWTNIYLGSLIDEETGKIPRDANGNVDVNAIKGLYAKEELLYLVYFDMPVANEILNPKNDVVAEIDREVDPILKVYDLWTSGDNLLFAMDDENDDGPYGWFVGEEDVVPRPVEFAENAAELIMSYLYSYDSDGSRSNPEDDSKPVANVEIRLNPDAKDSYAVYNVDENSELTKVEFYRPDGNGGGQFTGLKARDFAAAYFRPDAQLETVFADEGKTVTDMLLYIGTINKEMETSMFRAEVPESTYFEVFDADDKESYEGSLVLHTDAFFYDEGMRFTFFDGPAKSGTFVGTPSGEPEENDELDTWWKIVTDVTQNGEIFLSLYAPTALPAEGELPEFGEKPAFTTKLGKAGDGWNQTPDGNDFYFKTEGSMMKGEQLISGYGGVNEYLFNDYGYLLTGWQEVEEGKWAYYEEKGDSPVTSSYGTRYIDTILTAAANPDIIPADEIASGREYVYTFDENGILSGYSTKSSDSSSGSKEFVDVHGTDHWAKASEVSSFADVAAGKWYAEAVYWAAEQGIVSGYRDGLFGVNDPVTREQLAVMLWRYAGSPSVSGSLDYFNDADSARDYAKTALCWAVENGIISGVGDDLLAPAGEATRAQVAQMLKNFIQNGL